MREFYEQEYVPNCIAMGISSKDFWEMTPHQLEIEILGYGKKIERQRDYDNYIAYIQGIYMVNALQSTVGNMFKKKGSKPIEYPEKPLDLSGKPHELTEEEKEVQRIAFLESLKTMQMNFENNKKRERSE